MLAVDLSGSMKEQDFIVNNQAVDRLTATKAVANEFIERRVGDRIDLAGVLPPGQWHRLWPCFLPPNQ
jgi:hypothetical protein